MNPIGTFYSDKFLEHDMPGHPEHAGRLTAITTLLRHRAADYVQPMPFEAATHAQLCRVHRPNYVRDLERSCAFGGGLLDGGDTYTTEASFDAAALAAGACIEATRVVMRGEVKRTFALPRPPGHHAYADHAEGFCLFNNVAFAARCALDEFGLERVMIVDWDVHHGNGTESIFYDNPHVLYVSLHQYGGIYPGTGTSNAAGWERGAGANMNIPLPEGVGDKGYMRAFNELIAPKARQFKPQLILISAGYDAHWRDPLANMRVSLPGFARMTQSMVDLSDEFCGGKLVGVLEGGYDLEVLSHGVLATLQVMAGDSPDAIEDTVGLPKHELAVERLDSLFEQIKKTQKLT